MGDAAAAWPPRADGIAQKPFRRRALPLWIGGREVDADVAVGERAEDRIGQRVKSNVGVGMADQAAVMGNRHAAERHAAARTEGVDVVTGADADLAQARALPRWQGGGSAASISAIVVSFMFAGSPATMRTGMLRPFGNRRIVGERQARLGGAVMRRQDAGEAEALRGLRGVEIVAGDGAGDHDRRPRASACRSPAGRATTASPGRAPRPRVRREARETKGRAASWTRTRSGALAARASSPRRTDSCLVLPPSTGGIIRLLCDAARSNCSRSLFGDDDQDAIDIGMGKKGVE